MKHTDKIIAWLPHSSWVYQFFDTQKKIIYVGKSKNLKSRVSSYFNGTSKLNFAKKLMVEKVVDIEYIVTNNETESLILENTLIKKHQPRYNILLKDDKNFLYIKVTKEDFPQIIKTRIAPNQQKYSDGKYFWPYISWYYVFEILKLLKKIFWYGVWNHHFFKRKWAYTLDSYIFQGKIDADEVQQKKLYLEKIEQIQRFLAGDTQEIKERITQEMLQLAKTLHFEEAQKRKLSLEALESLETLQVVRDGVKGNYFVVQVLEKYEHMYIGVIEIFEGKIIHFENYEIENILEESSSTIVQNFVEQKWAESEEKRKYTFLLPSVLPTDISPEIIQEIPQIWPKFELLKLCYKNIYEYAHKKYLASLSTKSFSKKTMQNIIQLLGYTQINADIIFECNDISHLSWTHTVASRSVIENGKKNTKRYKKFRIKTLEQWKIDDFHSMREIMTRRIAELQKLQNFPDLIVIDGGKWQLWAVMEILQASEFEGKEKVQIVSLAKREEELFLPEISDPILLEKDSSELRLIQALRDEAHRFAITFNRDSRNKSLKKSILEAIPGIGPVTRKKILKLYGSVDALQNISKQELQKALGKSIVENLENHGIIS